VAASTRATSSARQLSQRGRGKLVCYDFAGYNACFELGVTEVGCMAHARRKFYELWANHGSQVGEQALKFFGQLYEVERAAFNADSQARLEARRAARPLANALNQWLRQQRQRVPDGSATARAIDYSLKRWAALTRYLDDSTCPSTTTGWRTASDPSLWGGRTGCSSAARARASGPRL
jgi:hypothetical protein